MTSKASLSATSSPVPGSGPSQLDLLAGLTSGHSGAPPVRANRSPTRGSGSVHSIQGICGRTYFESFEALAPAASDLLSSWESKLAGRLATIGSTESALIWRRKVTPAGHGIFRLARSTLLMNGTGCGGSLWPTPKAATAGPDFAKAERSSTGLSLQTAMAATSYWPTPKASAAGESSRSGDRANEPLIGGLMRGAMWSTPRASDGEKGAPRQEFSGGGQPLPAQIYANAETAMWVTPSARDFKDSEGMSSEGEQQDGDQIAIPGLEKRRQRVDQLPRQMVATESAMWTTPIAADGRGSGSRNAPGSKAHKGTSLSDQILTGSSTGRTDRGGATPSGSSATMGKRGAPNPVFACWLMGWPDELTSGALQAIQSFRSSRRKSSARSSTRKKK